MKVLEQKWWDKTRYLIFCGQGSVQLEIFKEPWGSQGIKAFIWGLYVNEDQRLEGLATALMDEAERIAREQGLETVYMEREEVNTPLAIYQWYERRGYEEKEMGPGCALMRKELNEQMSNSNEKD